MKRHPLYYQISWARELAFSVSTVFKQSKNRVERDLRRALKKTGVPGISPNLKSHTPPTTEITHESKGTSLDELWLATAFGVPASCHSAL